MEKIIQEIKIKAYKDIPFGERYDILFHKNYVESKKNGLSLRDNILKHKYLFDLHKKWY